MRSAPIVTVVLVGTFGVFGCAESGKDSPADGLVTGDFLEECLREQGLDVRQGEPKPISFGADPVTPEAGVIVEPESLSVDDVASAELLVLDEAGVTSYEDTLPAGFNDRNRFGENVIALLARVTVVGPLPEGPTVPRQLRRALNSCVN